jgi:type II secretory ATPase GspE/PulE/Tfp pilus assembly ATPase PilB-like protein
MGIEPFLIASSAVAFVAQRLVRRICDRCKKGYEATPELLRSLGMRAAGQTAFFRGEGCPACKNTGYRGRVGIFELMEVSDAVRTQIMAKASSAAIRAAAAQHGFMTLREEGLLKAAAGITSVEEVLRVTQDADVEESEK